MSSFYEKVWKLTKKIPRGRVTTYKHLAEALNTKAYRAVGTAMKKNKNAPKVPCHRVVNSDGTLGGYSGKGGIKTKIRLLKKEGVEVENNKIKNFEKKLYSLK